MPSIDPDTNGRPTWPILYSFRRCPYAIRARLAIAVSGTVCSLREVRLQAKPDALIEASAKATVPVLVMPGGQVIDQSLEIMTWSLLHNDPDGWLSRHDADLVQRNDGPFKHDLDRTKYPHRQGGDGIADRQSGLRFLTELEGRLRHHEQLCGHLPGFADMAIMPFVRQFAAIDPAWFAAQPLPRLQAWLDGHLRSDLFAAAMLRVPPWRPGDPETRFPAN